MEKEFKVDTYVTVWYCEECGGQMQPDGTVNHSDPPLFHHKCNNCGKKEGSSKRYPLFRYERKEE